MWEIKVHHINVGVGDSTLLLFYEKNGGGEELKRTVLIDGGLSGNQGKILALLRDKLPNNKKLDAIILTHDDLDHLGGLEELFKDNSFEQFLDKTFYYEQGVVRNSKSQLLFFRPSLHRLINISKIIPILSSDGQISNSESGKDADPYDSYLDYYLLGQDLLWNFMEFRILNYNQKLFMDRLQGAITKSDATTLDDPKLQEEFNQLRKTTMISEIYNETYEIAQCRGAIEQNGTRRLKLVSKVIDTNIQYFKKIKEVYDQSNPVNYSDLLTQSVQFDISLVTIALDILKKLINSINVDKLREIVDETDGDSKEGFEVLLAILSLYGKFDYTDLILSWARQLSGITHDEDGYQTHQSLKVPQEELEGITAALKKTAEQIIPHQSVMSLLQADADKSILKIGNIKTSLAGKPLLICVGVNEFQPEQKHLLEIVIDTSVTSQNRRSIACLLLSPDNEILHYLGGDITEVPEQKIADWLIAQKYDGKTKTPFMKLSHHGAKGSTPANLLKALNPEFAIVSAGNKFNHPAIALLKYINYFNQLFTPEKPVTILATNYPYYLDNSVVEKNGLIEYPNEIIELLSGKEQDNEYKNAINNLISEAKSHVDDNDQKNKQAISDLIGCINIQAKTAQITMISFVVPKNTGDVNSYVEGISTQFEDKNNAFITFKKDSYKNLINDERFSLSKEFKEEFEKKFIKIYTVKDYQAILDSYAFIKSLPSLVDEQTLVGEFCDLKGYIISLFDTSSQPIYTDQEKDAANQIISFMVASLKNKTALNIDDIKSAKIGKDSEKLIGWISNGDDAKNTLIRQLKSIAAILNNWDQQIKDIFTLMLDQGSTAAELNEVFKKIKDDINDTQDSDTTIEELWDSTTNLVDDLEIYFNSLNRLLKLYPFLSKDDKAIQDEFLKFTYGQAQELWQRIGNPWDKFSRSDLKNLAKMYVKFFVERDGGGTPTALNVDMIQNIEIHYTYLNKAIINYQIVFNQSQTVLSLGGQSGTALQYNENTNILPMVFKRFDMRLPMDSTSASTSTSATANATTLLFSTRSMPMLASTPTKSILYIGLPSAIQADWIVELDSTLARFLANLPGKALVLHEVSETVANNQVTLDGRVGGLLAGWLAQFHVMNLHCHLEGKQVPANIKMLAVINTNFTINSQFDFSETGSNDNIVNFTGVLDDNAVLTFRLSDNRLVTVNLLTSAQMVGLMPATETQIINDLLTALRVKTTGVLHRDFTQITFNPQRHYLTQVLLGHALGNITLFDDKLAFNNLVLAFANEAHPVTATSMTTLTSCFFNATLKLGEFKTDVSVSLDTRGYGSLVFKPEGDIATDLGRLFTVLGLPIDPDKFNQLGIKLKVIDQITLNFDFFRGKITSGSLKSSLTVRNIDFTVTLSFPHFTISGDLQISTAPPAADVFEESDFSEPTPPVPVPLQNFFTHADDSIPIPDQSLAAYTLVDISFSADIMDQSYSIYASLTGNNNTLWQFTNEIALKNIVTRLVIDRKNKMVEAALWGQVELVQSLITIGATYQKAQGDSTWLFSANVPYLSLQEILALFPLPANFSAELRRALPKIDFMDLVITLKFAEKLSERSFTFAGNLVIGDTILAVQADSTTKLITATWYSSADQGLSLEVLLQQMGIDLPLPSDFDIALTAITFKFDISKKIIVLDVMTNLGEAEWVIFPQQNTYQTVMTIRIAIPTTLHGIPLVKTIPLPIDTLNLVFSQSELTQPLLNALQAETRLLPAQTLPAGIGLVLTLSNARTLTFPLLTKRTPSVFPLFNAAVVTSDAAVDPTAVISWVSIQKSLGPLMLNRVGVSYQTKQLWLFLDATLAMGGLLIQLEGLGCGLVLDQLMKGNIDPAVQLNGLGVGYSAGMVTIGGSFFKNVPPLEDTNYSYSGAVVVGAAGFNLAGIGSYAQLRSGHPSVFMFAQANSAEGFGGPPYFYIKGLSGGLGYNWQLRLPEQDEVVTFPLVQGANRVPALGNQNLLEQSLAVLAALEGKGQTADKKPWLTPRLGENWLAVGINFSTFELVNSQALLVAELGKEFQLGLLGRSWMQLPQAGPPLAYVEMGLEAVLKPASGFFGVSAVLSRNSYVLDPACHLTGGCAFYTWFAGEHAGDFVVTLGGYHPNFDLAAHAHYPKEPRLGFNWKVNNNLSLSGESYCALTPSCIMAGGALNAVFQSGDLRAWFKAYADFLMNWKPFHYTAEIHVQVGASYKLNMALTTKTLHAELGADLSLVGPPLHGRAHVQWWVISFTIEFGPKPRQTAFPAISWDEFKTLLPHPRAVTSAGVRAIANADAQQQKIEICNVQVTGGLIRQETDGTWVVRADEFSFATESAIPITAIELKDEMTTLAIPQAQNPPPLAIKPMQQHNITSSHAVLIQSLQGQQKAAPWQASLVKRNVPDALWGDASVAHRRTDTIPAPPVSAKLLFDRWMGLAVQTPPATPGESPGPIEMQTHFTRVTPQNLQGRLPLNNQPQTDASLQKVPNAIAVLSETIASVPTQQRRSHVVDYLRQKGLFNASARLSSMQRLANQATQAFHEAPLIRD
jgi:beta-lactamase superfamily II metal-dependent hydrolase